MRNKQLLVPLMENHDRTPMSFSYLTTPLSQEHSQVGSKVL